MAWNDDEDDESTGFDTSDADEEETTAECPHCGEMIFDDAERCPECGEYVSEEDAPAGRKPTWVIVGAVICLLIVLLWVFGGVF